jgi:hypothetical protein
VQAIKGFVRWVAFTVVMSLALDFEIAHSLTSSSRAFTNEFGKPSSVSPPPRMTTASYLDAGAAALITPCVEKEVRVLESATRLANKVHHCCQW